MEGLVQLLPMIVFAVLLIVPTIRVLGRAGKSRWWVLLLLLPFFGIIPLMWILAYSRWPAERSVADVFA
jgi:uncharacterized membrane protein YhaH (DUF805 family)